MAQEVAGRVRPGRFGAVVGLGIAAVWLCAAAVVGAIWVAGDDGDGASTAAATHEVESGTGPAATSPVEGPTTQIDPATGQPVQIDPATGKPVPAAATGAGGTATGQSAGSTGPAATAPPVTTPGNRTGVTDTEIKYGVHAPLTINNAPLALAEDPVTGVKGYLKFINDAGGINGRKVTLDLQDDKYTVEGGTSAGKKLVADGNFFISGTLGVDQIAQVANEARKAGVPYLAAGGHEPQFANFGVHQLSTSYDTHVLELARFLAIDPKYKGKRVGVAVLDSEYLRPVAEVFNQAAAANGVKIVSEATIQKPDQQTSYAGLIQKFTNDRVEVYVPLHDPISTARIVTECGVTCPWTYTFSNFAHDADVALTLFHGRWGDLGVRGLSGACYYLAPQAYDPTKCAQMTQAHDQWVKVYDEDSWKKDGQGGASGYQLVYFWVKAMKDAGRDLTRERFVAALRSYDHYNNLITGPITFRGKGSYAHGSEQMVVYEAQTNETYKQLSPGLTNSY